MQLKTLGRLELEGSSLSRPKPLLLLTYLTVEGSKSRADLAELFYLGASNPMSSLRVAINHLRSEAEQALELEGSRVVSVIASDAKGLLVAWERQDYQKVTELYSGAFLDGFSLKDMPVELEDWVYGTREYLALLVRKAFLRLAQQVAQASFKEAARLAAKGYKVSGAPEPEPEELRQLYGFMLAGNHPDLAELKKLANDYGFDLESAEISLKTQTFLPELQATPSNLQARSSSFVGRVQELTEIKDLLKNSSLRVITLHGQGGIGKTRLAEQVGLELLHEGQFKDGIYFVGLESLNEESQITLSLAKTLGLNLGNAEPFKQICEFIGEKSVLLILDNFEHLTSAATLCSDLFRQCPNLFMLVSSREALNISEESIYELSGLSLPTTEHLSLEVAQTFEVIQLFSDRARRAKLNYNLTDEELPTVISLCRLLEGLPLGIELVAASLRLMPAKDIELSIRQDLDTLYSPSRDLSERHQSLRATFDYSIKLLSDSEKKVLIHLAIFQGGFGRDSASQVVGATLPILRSLVDKALLRVSADGRFNYHMLLYQYLFEKLERDPNYPELREKHAAYYLKLSEEAEPKLIGKGQLEWLNRLELEHDNLRAALSWNLANKPEHALRQATSLRRFWEIRSYFNEGSDYLRNAVNNAPEKNSESYLKAIYALGALLRSNFANDEAEPYFIEAEELAKSLGNKQVLADTLNQLAGIAWVRGKLEDSHELLNQSLEIKRELNDKRGTAISLENLGLLAKMQQNYDLAITLYQECLEIYKNLSDTTYQANVLRNLGQIMYLEGTFVKAQNYLQESLEHFKELGSKNIEGQILNDLACIACHNNQADIALNLLEKSSKIAKDLGMPRDVANVLQGYGLVYYLKQDFEQAASYFEKGLRLAHEVSDLGGMASALEGLASIAVQKQKYQLAATLWGVSQGLEQVTESLKTFLKAHYERDLVKAEKHLGESVLKELMSKGKLLSVDKAVELALVSELQDDV